MDPQQTGGPGTVGDEGGSAGDLHQPLHVHSGPSSTAGGFQLGFQPGQLNRQRVEKRVVREDGALDVVEVFATIQGEGPFVGTPAIFVRLAGCNLQCPLCDTDYTSRRRLMTPQELMLAVMGQLGKIKGRRWGPGHREGYNRGLIVLTGGEPLRQSCGPFVRVASANFNVQIETNGVFWDESLGIRGNANTLPDGVTLVCSPKTQTIDPILASWVKAFKYVLRAHEIDDRDGLPTAVLGYKRSPARPPEPFYGEVYVQPADEGDPAKNKANLEAAVASCMKFGYRLCLQTHKIIGLP